MKNSLAHHNPPLQTYLTVFLKYKLPILNICHDKYKNNTSCQFYASLLKPCGDFRAIRNQILYTFQCDIIQSFSSISMDHSTICSNQQFADLCVLKSLFWSLQYFLCTERVCPIWFASHSSSFLESRSTILNKNNIKGSSGRLTH